MSRKSKIIVCLLVAAVILFGTLELYAIPAYEAEKESYAKRQTDARTHDISAIEQYKEPYMGNAGNITQLMNALPLNDISKTFEIKGDSGTLTVNYQAAAEEIGRAKVQRDMVYNTVAAMASIDNLLEIVYQFSDGSYSFAREEVEEAWETPLPKLLEKKIWDREVRGQLNSREFVRRFSAFAEKE